MDTNVVSWDPNRDTNLFILSLSSFVQKNVFGGPNNANMDKRVRIDSLGQETMLIV